MGNCESSCIAETKVNFPPRPEVEFTIYTEHKQQSEILAKLDGKEIERLTRLSEGVIRLDSCYIGIHQTGNLFLPGHNDPKPGSHCSALGA